MGGCTARNPRSSLPGIPSKGIRLLQSTSTELSLAQSVLTHAIRRLESLKELLRTPLSRINGQRSIETTQHISMACPCPFYFHGTTFEEIDPRGCAQQSPAFPCNRVGVTQ